MDNTITIEQIQATETFKKLNDIQKGFVVKRANREILTNALIIHKNSGQIAGTIHGYNIGVLNDLITKSN